VKELTEVVTYDRICGTVASLLFLFARIENEAREIVSKVAGPESLTNVIGARGTLLVWKKMIAADREARPEEAKLAERLWAQLQDPLDVRNGICHGLVGASAERGDAPATLMWRVKDGTVSKTYEELQEMFAWLSRVPLAMAMVSHAVCEKDPSTLRPFPKREFWEDEFRIIYDTSV
jgi:hypothetical protein